MSSVSRFVNGNGQRSATPPAATRPERAAEMSKLKVPPKAKRSSIVSAPPLHQLVNTAPNPGYDSNLSASRNTYPNAQYQAQQQAQVEGPGDMFDATITSFDDTKSEIEMERGDYGRHADYDTRQEEDADFDGQDETYHADINMHASRGLPTHTHKLHHMRSQEHLQRQEDIIGKQATSNISGRFHPSPQRLRQPALFQQARDSKKRGRPEEGFPNITNNALLTDSEPPEEGELSDLQESIDGGRARDQAEEGHQLEPPNGRAEYGSQMESPSRRRLTQQNHFSSLQTYISDYTDDQLRAMAYADLKSETWDSVPEEGFAALPKELRGPKVTLEKKVGHYAQLKDEDKQAIFFEQMPTEEWQRAGDCILTQMASLIEKVKTSRENQRKVTEKFEAVYEAREGLVRGKSLKYESMLKDMRASGEGVLRGRV